MPELFPWLLLLHVLGAIIAFGPTFAFPLIGAMAGKEPMHANFATRVTHKVSDRLVEPVALSMAVTGVAMIWSVGINPFAAEYRWLLIAIVMYVLAVLFSVIVQRPKVMRVIELTGGDGGVPAPPAGPDRPSAGPPPALSEAIGAVQRNGMILGLGLIVIVFLMVVKPSLGG